MAQAYTGQGFNLALDPQMAKPLDVRSIQLTEAEAKTPATWLNGGLYCIPKGYPISTQDGKILVYIGRDGNSTDIADNTKWIKFASQADVQAAIAGLAAPLHYAGQASSLPANPSEGDVYLVTSAITVPAASSVTGAQAKAGVKDKLVAMSVNDTIKFDIWQGNLDDDTVVNSTATTVADGDLVAFDGTSPTTIKKSGISVTALTALLAEFAGTAASVTPNNPATNTLGKLIKDYRDNGGVLTENSGLAKGVLGTGGVDDPYRGLLLVGEVDANGKIIVDTMSVDRDTITGIVNEYDGHVSDNLELCNQSGWSQQMDHRRMVNLTEKAFIAEMTRQAGIPTTDEDAFIAAVADAGVPHVQNASIFNPDYNVGGSDAPVRIVLGIVAGANNNFFGFVKSAPRIPAIYVKGNGSTIHDTVRFKNYDFAGTLSSPCVEYTYDMDAKRIYYNSVIEVAVPAS